MINEYKQSNSAKWNKTLLADIIYKHAMINYQNFTWHENNMRPAKQNSQTINKYNNNNKIETLLK